MKKDNEMQCGNESVRQYKGPIYLHPDRRKSSTLGSTNTSNQVSRGSQSAIRNQTPIGCSLSMRSLNEMVSS